MLLANSKSKISPHRISTCFVQSVEGIDKTKREQTLRALGDEVLRRIIERLEIDCDKMTVFRADKTNMWMNRTYIENKIRIHHCHRELDRRCRLRRAI